MNEGSSVLLFVLIYLAFTLASDTFSNVTSGLLWCVATATFITRGCALAHF